MTHLVVITSTATFNANTMVAIEFETERASMSIVAVHANLVYMWVASVRNYLDLIIFTNTNLTQL
jgi:hypothetical protein